MPPSASTRPPRGLKWRSSVWFTTLIVGFGVATDLFVYAVIIPVTPFELESLGYANASALTGWLLFAYSGGLAVSTPPIAWLSEHYNARRIPLLLGLVCLLGAQVMFMLAPTFWLMALARILQGISSSFVWTVGLALLCDVTPESRVGQQLGLAMTGLSAGVVLAPPIGGALYQAFGFHAPFIFSIGIVLIDLFGRLLIIERKDALLWGFDPAAESLQPDPESLTEVAHGVYAANAVQITLSQAEKALSKPSTLVEMDRDKESNTALGSLSDIGRRASSSAQSASEAEVARVSASAEGLGHTSRSPSVEESPVAVSEVDPEFAVAESKAEPISSGSPESLKGSLSGSADGRERDSSQQSDDVQEGAGQNAEWYSGSPPVTPQSPAEKPRLTSMQVLCAMCLSPRALAAFTNTLIFGITYSAQEPTLPLRLRAPYGLSAMKVGLIYIASSVPTLLSGPLAGRLADRKGTGSITIFCLLMSIPWLIVMAIHGPLALLIAGFVISNFFISAVVAPLTAELAAVTRQMPGVGYSHVYGAFNLAYGIGSAIGPILGGQLYDHVKHGWTAVVACVTGLILVAITVAFFYTDETPPAKWLVRRVKRVKVDPAPGPEGRST